MDELVQSINSIVEIMKNGAPVWITWLSAFAPVLLTVISIVVSCRMDKQNRELQRTIHDRDAYIQSRQDILSIYNVFSEAQNVLCKYGSVEMVFTNEQNTLIWVQEVNIANIEISKAYNKAELLFSDEKLINLLDSARKTFQEIRDCVSRYVYNNTYLQVLQDARQSLSSQFSTLPNMMYSTAAREQLVKLCENDNTREITKSIESYSKAISDDEYEKKFREYIILQELPNKLNGKGCSRIDK